MLPIACIDVLRVSVAVCRIYREAGLRWRPGSATRPASRIASHSTLRVRSRTRLLARSGRVPTRAAGVVWPAFTECDARGLKRRSLARQDCPVPGRHHLQMTIHQSSTVLSPTREFLAVGVGNMLRIDLRDNAPTVSSLTVEYGSNGAATRLSPRLTALAAPTVGRARR